MIIFRCFYKLQGVFGLRTCTGFIEFRRKSLEILWKVVIVCFYRWQLGLFFFCLYWRYSWCFKEERKEVGKVRVDVVIVFYDEKLFLVLNYLLVMIFCVFVRDLILIIFFWFCQFLWFQKEERGRGGLGGEQGLESRGCFVGWWLLLCWSYW